tara:strand:- start:365 stop:1015 length:651 start_codon:yes stop_codon:yes gene_type:complete
MRIILIISTVIILIIFSKYKFLRNYQIEDIKIINNKYLSEDKILNKISLKNKNFFSLNLKNISDQVLSIGEVQSVRLEKRFNGDIYLFIEEKRPISFWIKEDKKYLIDSEGQILEMKKSFFNNLLIVKGEDANIKASRIIEKINIFPKIKVNLSYLEFKSKYRWNLYFKENIIVKLPYKDIEKALNFLSYFLMNKDFKLNKFKVIDMRVNGRVFLR